MKKTTKPGSKKDIVNRYAKMIAEAEKAWDTELVARLLVDRNRLLDARR